MNKINVYGSDSTHPHDKTDFWFYVYEDVVDNDVEHVIIRPKKGEMK